MFIKVKRALYSTSCIYSSHTHTQHPHTHTHTLSLALSLCPSLALLLSQAVCPHGNEGCSNNNKNDCKVINTLCKTATKKKNKKAKHSAAKEKKKQKRRIGLGRVASLGGWGRSLWVRVYFCAGLLLLLLLLLLFALFFSYCRCLGRRRCC